MSQICTLSHSATTDTAAPHPLTTECMGYEAKKWEMRLARVNERRCWRCGKFQRYTIVDAGRRKIWLTFSEPVAPTQEGGSE